MPTSLFWHLTVSLARPYRTQTKPKTHSWWLDGEHEQSRLALAYHDNQPPCIRDRAARQRTPTRFLPDLCGYAKTAGQYGLPYQTAADSQVIRLHITGFTSTNQAGVAGFYRASVDAMQQAKANSAYADERVLGGIN